MTDAGDRAVTTLRVATVPDDHPYLDAVLPVSATHVRFARPDDLPWAPSPLFDLDFLRGAAARFDLVHVHFGYESLSAQALATWLESLAQLGKPLVVTVHDLRNPHHRHAQHHDEHLSLLLAAAAEVLTLTEGAAAEIEARWARRPGVAAHPSLLTSSPLPTPSSVPQVVGVHLKSLRTNVVDPAGLVAAIIAGARGATVRVDVHPDVADRPELAAIRRAADRSLVDLRVHPRFDDDGLVSYLAGLHTSVLPYRFGTHSGWLELCRDLGTHVLVPDCGYYRDQWADAVAYVNNERAGLDPASLTAAVQQVLIRPAVAPADRTQRLRHVSDIRKVHGLIYRAAVARRLVAS